ncbi:MAG TPA: diacylglycerol kinase family protein [Candidatus Ozemobacteraceae bacterium]|nr:diacylglycerol kinase family protein [Candidatus Ozemobacteraceae bacterium]
MLHIFLNQTANRGGAGERWRLVEQELQRRARPYTAHVLQAPGDLDRLLPELWTQGARQFAAAGGDGTLQLVVEAVMRHVPGEQRGEIRLGAIGIGTSNDFHKKGGVRPAAPRTDGQPVVPPHAASSLWNGVPCRLDEAAAHSHDVLELIVKKPDGTTETHWCLQAVHAGTIPVTNQNLTRGGGWCQWMYGHWYWLSLQMAAMHTLFSYAGFEAEIEVNSASISGTFTGMTLLKRCNIAGQFVFATHRTPNDGQIDLAACRKVSGWRMIQLIIAFTEQGFAGHPEVEFRETSEVRAQFSAPQWIDYDGELVQAVEAQVRVLSAALTMLG